MYRAFRKMHKRKNQAAKEPQQQADQKDKPPKNKRDLLKQVERQYVDDLRDVKIDRELDVNQKMLEGMFTDSSDFVIRAFEVEKGPQAVVIFVDGLIDTAELNAALKVLMVNEGGLHDLDALTRMSLPVSQITEVDNYADLVKSVLSGDSGILIDGEERAVLLGLRGAKGRSVQEPETESVVRGPREGYVENIRTNTAMLRRKMKTPHLKMRSMTLGRESNTDIVVAYHEGLSDPATLQEVIGRLEKIDIDAVLDSGYLEEMIQDNTYSPFPQVQYTERPDTTAAALLEGRFAIFADGSPFALVVPTTFWQLMQANEDYYERFQMATMIRWLRYLFVVVALTTPALYIAITTYHQAMIPTTLLLSLAAARESIPFPAVVEAFIMEIAFEALREAGVRLPKTVGQAVSILGALVIGQAAVEAGIVSAPMVIIVSVTGIASFTIPRYNAAIAVRMLRFPLMILAALFGIYGILLGMMLILGHLANLRSFGVPYLSPLGPLSTGDLKDVLIRAPWWAMGDRPAFLELQDKHRIGEGIYHEIAAQGGQIGEQVKHGADRDKGGEKG